MTQLQISLLLTATISLLHLVVATPYEAYPIGKQYPPVARVNESFTFQISNDTYKSSVDKTAQITYNCFDLPSWLSFDSSSRTFSGEPSSDLLSDANTTLYFNVILEGTDSADSTSLNNTYQFVVTNRPSISLSSDFNLLALLKNYGYTNGKNALKLDPNEVFNVTFDRSMFTNEESIVSYYGRSQLYNAPLPNWLFFDSGELKFTGTAPVINSAIAPETSYSFVIIATDIEGFSAVEVEFELVIGAHQLTTSIQNSLIINVTDTGNVSYDLPLNYVYLDDDPISSDKLGSINLLDAPDWVALDNATISGSVPDELLGKNSNPANFSVSIYDTYGDVIYFNFEVVSTTDLFAISSLPNINATRGEWFSYYFLPSQFTDYVNTNVSLEFTNSSQDHDWVKFQSSNLTLAGEVPKNFDKLSLGLKANQGSQSQELYFNIIGMDSKITHSNHSANATSTRSSHHSTSTSSYTSSTYTAKISSTSAAATSSAPAALPAANKTSSHNKKAVAIACGVAIPLGVILVALICFLIFWRRRRENPDDENLPHAISGPDLNNPANKPNQENATPLNNPFDDDASSYDDTSIARRLAALNTLKLDNHSATESDISSVDEKRDSLSGMNTYNDQFQSQSKEELLAKPPVQPSESPFFDPQNRSSSVYMDSEPAVNKSWRYTGNLSPVSDIVRDSYGSQKTVDTEKLFDLEAPEKEKRTSRDVTMSSLDPWNSNISPSPVRKSVTPSPYNVTKHRNRHLQNIQDSQSGKNGITPTTMSTSSSDDFVPVKDGENFCWVHSMEPDRRPSKKRLVDFSNKSNVNVGQVKDIHGRIPEML
ncbi:AQG_2a_G0026280.mRNA.1.CDS.1 [Saccharomyces cerevisiae]|nr:Axl2p [Saccharomyces cerevisiae YJM193]AJR37744.1 Axl2p [Saccharomyces cerevisiae YJM271]AJR46889.1 Axl2p [Saccharomyces cerevisiae YJM1341]AJR51578.1 Axl2p [Saccharomyces cerevisiae YJM1450]AJR51956.1 Axl2p [Saccharomyces cerevisiae YJM1463]CAI4381808.1 BLD_1a_G0025910.mRNA.1.CDS.1 [Saccharomyces cerevisiae]